MLGLRIHAKRNWQRLLPFTNLKVSRGQQQRYLARISSREPRFKVPAHIAAFSLIFVPTVGFSLLYASRFAPSEEDLESNILENYEQSIRDRGILEKNQQVGEFFGEVFEGKEGKRSKSVQKQLDALLAGGRDKHGRLQEFDDVTAERLRKSEITKVERAERLKKLMKGDEDYDDSTVKKKRRRKKKIRKKPKQVTTASADTESEPGHSRTIPIIAGTATAVAAVAVLVTSLGGAKK